MMRSRKDWLALTIALFLFAAFHLICTRVLSSAAFVEVLVELDHRDRLQIFYSDGREFSEQRSSFSAMVEPGQLQRVHIPLQHASVYKLRLDLGEQPGKVRLYSMTVAGFFAEDPVLSPPEIFRLFSSHAPGTVVQLEQDAVAVQTGADSYIISKEPLLHPNFLLVYGLPLLFALLAFILFQQTEFSRLAPFADLHGRRFSAGEHLDVLDGLRGIAVMMVTADHTWGLFSGLGTSGVWIFMTLSGFLITRPFIQQPERAVSLSYLSRFFVRRAKRIIPVYYTYIIVVFLLHGRFDEAVLHSLFLKGSGHLWVVPQEMLFYLLTPPLMLMSFLLLRGRPLLVIPVLIVLMLTVNRFLGTNVITLRGMNDIGLRLYFGVFLAGVIVSWFFHGIWQKKAGLELRQKCKPWAAGLTLILLLFFILCSEGHLWNSNRIFTQIYFPWFGAAAAILIAAALAAEGSAAVRFLSSLPLRAISLVSFSFYIFHPLMIDILRKGAMYYWAASISGFPLFAATLVLSYLFACVSYSLLERPFLRSA